MTFAGVKNNPQNMDEKHYKIYKTTGVDIKRMYELNF